MILGTLSTPLENSISDLKSVCYPPSVYVEERVQPQYAFSRNLAPLEKKIIFKDRYHSVSIVLKVESATPIFHMSFSKKLALYKREKN